MVMRLKDYQNNEIMKFIELTIKCNNESDKVAKMRDLDIPISEEDAKGITEYRPLYIRTELIDGFYPDTDGGCFVFIGGMEITIGESYAEVKKLVG